MITFNELHRHVLKAKKDNTPLPKNLSRKEQHQLTTTRLSGKWIHATAKTVPALQPVPSPPLRSRTARYPLIRKNAQAAPNASKRAKMKT